MLKKAKENKELKSIEVNVVSNFIKDGKKSFYNAEFYTDDHDDDDDSQGDRVIGFR